MTKTGGTHDIVSLRVVVTTIVAVASALLFFFLIVQIESSLAKNIELLVTLTITILLVPFLILMGLTGKLGDIKLPGGFEITFDGPSENSENISEADNSNASESTNSVRDTPTDNRTQQTTRRSILKVSAPVVVGLGLAYTLIRLNDGGDGNGGDDSGTGDSRSGSGEHGGSGDGISGSNGSGDNGNREGGGETSDKLDNSIVIAGTKESPGTRYTVEVSGELKQATGTIGGISVTDNPDETIEESRVDGRVGSGADGYWFSGNITAFSLTDYDQATVYVNEEEEPNPQELADKNPLDRTLVIEGSPDGPYNEYSFTVSHELLQVGGQFEGIAVSKDGEEDIDGTTVSGAVTEGADGFRFSGNITAFCLTDPDKATVYVDGETKNPNNLTSSSACNS